MMFHVISVAATSDISRVQNASTGPKAPYMTCFDACSLPDHLKTTHIQRTCRRGSAPAAVAKVHNQ